ncbi:MAG TPA: DNA cytosine methyltransferase [Stenotrophomonas sp.]|nr:DNA cytosine methyltransferase [Stenotrophomonas sp.]
MADFEILHGHLFCGLGGGAAGFNDARPDIGTARGAFRCIGGIDVDAGAIADFGRLAGVPGTVMDLFDRDQYRAFWGCEPPADWREATTTDVHRAFGGERPHVVFLSAPCKGFSGLMAETKSRTDKYQALNRLTERGVMLCLEAYKDDPVEIYIFENVPRIATRGRHLLDRITALFRAYGYEVAETTHDCGELGGLSQSRKRFLMVARHREKVPPFLYEPVKRPLQSVGTVLGRMPLAGDVERAGPMHRVPSLQWKTWVRLAFVEAGNDWRSLNRLAVEDGHLRDYLIVPESRGGYLGVRTWGEPAGTVAGESLPSNGAFSVADPRAAADAAQYQQYGVMRMQDTAGAVIGVKSPGQGTFSIADPRHAGPAKHNNEFRIVPWAGGAGAVTGAHGSGQCVQDVRAAGGFEGKGKYRVTGYGESAGTVIARSDTGQGAFAVADPRPANQRQAGDAYLTNGHYGVVSWEGASGAVSAAAGHDNGRWSVADPRLPGARENLVCVIRSLDGTWHRPFTTLELAALQSLVDPEEKLELDGLSDQAWRERIGNAVPRYSATAIGQEIGRTLLLAWTGQTFALSSTPIWVRDVAVAMSLQGAHA